jgi:ArsR family transcriptional regulator
MLAIASLDVGPLSRVMKALSDPARLRIVALLTHGELCVCHIESALGLTQSNTSRHLSVLRSAGIVEPRREGGWVFYRLARPMDELCKAQVRALVGTFSKREQLRRDVVRLLKVRGPPSCR